MAINYNDPYNQGLGTPNLGNMNVGQVPVNNMQQANWLNTISGGILGTTPEQDAQNATLEQIQDLRNQEQQINALGEGAQYLKQDELKSIQEQIQELKNQYPEVESIQSAFLDDDEFSGIEGQTASLINPITKKMWDMVRIYNAAKKIKKHGPKVLKTIGTLTGGAAQAADRSNIRKIEEYTGRPISDYRRSRPASERQFTGHGKSGMGRDKSKLMAHGGRASYLDGGLLSLWPR